jgi:hypothetical protein
LTDDKKIIGRRELVTLPDWGLKMVTCKIDTGAYTSSIHCDYIEEKTVDGKQVLFFTLLDPGHKKYNGQILQTDNFSRKKVKNSFGQAEIRYLLNTKVTMFGQTFEAEFTLTDRTKMRNSILLGRRVLNGRFLVDVQGVNLSKKNKR